MKRMKWEKEKQLARNYRTGCFNVSSIIFQRFVIDEMRDESSPPGVPGGLLVFSLTVIC